MSSFLLFATALLGPLLLFTLQPVVAKLLLPVFGGVPAVWSACTMFFQCALLLGYLGALVVDRYLPARRQLAAFVALLLIAIPLLPWSGELSPPETVASPALEVVRLLVVLIGVPFSALAMLSPLLQGVSARLSLIRTPYRLYALSNIGSLTALLLYPTVLEPSLALSTQLRWWSICFCGFTALVGLLALGTRNKREVTPAAPQTLAQPQTSIRSKSLWILLPCVSTILLLAFTNHLCADISPIPMLWIAPLALYLISFIIPFGRDSAYSRRYLFPIAAILLLGMNVNTITGPAASTSMLLAYTLTTLFVLCLICHGELYQLRPDTSELTLYYLSISFGGAVGGVFVGLIAPSVFHSIAELPIGLVGAILTCTIAAVLNRFTNRGRALPRRHALIGATVLAVLLSATLVHTTTLHTGDLASVRNFFGVVTVRALGDDAATANRSMIVGRIVHGAQYQAPERRSEPTTYYSRETALGQLFDQGILPNPRRIGAIGLGVGTIAAYARAGDLFRFYEINPQVVALATQYFTFLSDAKGQTETVLGDARLQLEKEPPQHFDLLVLDAFSGDAIPTHLLTIEAFRTYVRHLNPNGIIAIHLSNRHVNLHPVLRGLAQGIDRFYCDRPSDDSATVSYVFIAPTTITLPGVSCSRDSGSGAKTLFWSDQFASIFPILVW